MSSLSFPPHRRLSLSGYGDMLKGAEEGACSQSQMLETFASLDSLYSSFSDSLRATQAVRLISNNPSVSLQQPGRHHLPIMYPRTNPFGPPRHLTLKPSSDYMSAFDHCASPKVEISAPLARPRASSAAPRRTSHVELLAAASSSQPFNPRGVMRMPNDNGSGLLMGSPARQGKPFQGHHAEPVHGARAL